MMEIKKRLSNQALKSKLIECFEKGITLKTNCYDFLRSDYALMKERVFEIFDTVYLDWNSTRTSAIEEQIGINAKDSLMLGLWKKHERMLLIQNNINSISELLKIGRTLQTVIVNGEPLEFARALNPSEIANYHKAKIMLHSELSKMDGSYAPIKAEVKESREIVTLFEIPRNYRDAGT